MSLKLPVLKMVEPSSLRGTTNGRLPDALLVAAHIPGGNFRLHPHAARAMRAMLAALAAAGFQVRATGTYRDFAAQLSLFTSRYRPVNAATYWVTPISRRRRWAAAPTHGFSSTYWIKRQLPGGQWPASAASPGMSNHGDGLAVDFAEERDGDPGVEGISTAMTGWLIANAATFGWSAEDQSEPWHWRYIAGDAVPAAVIAFEVGLQAPSPAPLPAPLPPPGAPEPVDLAGLAAGIARAKTHVLREGAGSGGPGPERDAVIWAQTALARAGYQVGPIDGRYGGRTTLCVHAFQMDRGLTNDGIVGPRTWAHMWP